MMVRNVFYFLRLYIIIMFKRRYFVMNNNFAIFLCALFAVIHLCSCNKDDTAEKWAKEEAILETWIKENRPNAVFDNGIYIEIIEQYPDNIQPEPGDHLLVDFVCRFLFDDVVEQVSFKDWRSYGALNESTYREGGPELWAPGDSPRLSVGIDNLRENEFAFAYVPSRILNYQDFISRKFEIKLVKVIDTDLKSYQEELMRCTMSKFNNKIDTITITDNGRDFYIIYNINEGEGDDVEVSSAKTRYTEMYYLQNDTPLTCVTNQEKTGWDRKFAEMFETVKKGGTITAVMPYRLMYHDDSYKDNNKQYIAPPGSVLKYEISIDN